MFGLPVTGTVRRILAAAGLRTVGHTGAITGCLWKVIGGKKIFDRRRKEKGDQPVPLFVR
jgi:hypothetical protein